MTTLRTLAWWAVAACVAASSLLTFLWWWRAGGSLAPLAAALVAAAAWVRYAPDPPPHAAEWLVVSCTALFLATLAAVLALKAYAESQVGWPGGFG